MLCSLTMPRLFPPEVMFDVSQKRAKKSVDRCIEFTDACIRARSDGKLPAAMCLFAPISGACYERERERGAAELANKAVEGFSICGLGTGEGFSETLKMVEVSVSKLPMDKPRIMHGVGTPEEVLACVGLGADLFETSYPSMLTSQGCAMLVRFSLSLSFSFSLSLSLSHAHAHARTDTNKHTSTQINTQARTIFFHSSLSFSLPLSIHMPTNMYMKIHENALAAAAAALAP